MIRHHAGWLCLALYVGTIFAANWALQTFGFIPVWPGLDAPAGVLFAGLALGLRDVVQDALGRRWTAAAIIASGALSFLVAPSFAVASAAAFLSSELADMAVYTPLRRRTWAGAVLLSNTVGLVIDSALFLWLAFGSLAFLAGQIVGKVEVTLLTVAVLSAWRWWRAPRVEPVPVEAPA